MTCRYCGSGRVSDAVSADQNAAAHAQQLLAQFLNAMQSANPSLPLKCGQLFSWLTEAYAKWDSTSDKLLRELETKWDQERDQEMMLERLIENGGGIIVKR